MDSGRTFLCWDFTEICRDGLQIKVVTRLPTVERSIKNVNP